MEMKRWFLITAVVLAFFAMVSVSRAQTHSANNARVPPGNLASTKDDEGLGTGLRSLISEVKTLRFELQRQLIESQGLRISRLHEDLNSVKAKQQGLQREENTLEKEIARIDQRLSQPDLAAEEQTTLQTARANLVSHSLMRLQADRQRLTQTDTDLTVRLQQAEQSWQVTVEKAKQLRPMLEKQQSGQPEDPIALFNRLAGELRNLTSEFQQQQLEYRQHKMNQLQMELEQLRMEQERLQAEEHDLSRELNELERQLGQPALADEERTILVSSRDRVLGHGMNRLRSERQRIAQQEAAIIKQLDQEQIRCRETLESIQKRKS
jgi:hypothetical protein